MRDRLRSLHAASNERGASLYEAMIAIAITSLLMIVTFYSIDSATRFGFTSIARDSLTQATNVTLDHIRSNPNEVELLLFAGDCPDNEEGRERIDVGGLPDGSCVMVSGTHDHYIVTLDALASYGIYDSESMVYSTYLK